MQLIDQWKEFSPGEIQALPEFSSAPAVHMLRLDQLRSWSSGNKYYKLKYPLQFILENKITTVVSKGGMFSNHLAALAEACHVFGIRLICIVRSYMPDDSNPSIQKLRELNSEVKFVTPGVYDQFDEAYSNLHFPAAFFIDEGGLSAEGIRGSAEIAREFQGLGYNHIVIAGGSMCTTCGLMASLPAETTLHVVPAWKGCDRDYIQSILSNYNINPTCRWDIWSEYHFGGFGKFNQALIDFMIAFTSSTGIVLDPVYTGKLLFAVQDKIKSNFFGKDDSVLIIHTGGLQGLKGYAYRFPEQWKDYNKLASEILTGY